MTDNRSPKFPPVRRLPQRLHMVLDYRETSDGLLIIAFRGHIVEGFPDLRVTVWDKLVCGDSVWSRDR
ncbi:hypothetical protein [Planotetraspora mira]|uniref:Uncharacterized protein n=1 Tax=Planotetraspora mira TaxID=58121 RepID=A0A8J3TUX2_9ACTN|nr:hypothetical protein [Planotetraspora mira]GII32938.1 hypothetical protein Pmi06nite_63800 [Planotetraspora mira]